MPSIGALQINGAPPAGTQCCIPVTAQIMLLWSVRACAASLRTVYVHVHQANVAGRRLQGNMHALCSQDAMAHS